jgi:isocitrate/isopropylmalate dehydrogenase
MAKKTIAVLYGDGIGPEIMAEAIKILDIIYHIIIKGIWHTRIRYINARWGRYVPSEVANSSRNYKTNVGFFQLVLF